MAITGVLGPNGIQNNGNTNSSNLPGQNGVVNATGNSTGGNTGGTSQGLLTQAQNTLTPSSTRDNDGLQKSTMLDDKINELSKTTPTLSGKIGELLDADSGLVQRARSLGQKFANDRGLINSSMAADATQAQLYDVITPIAQADTDIEVDNRNRLLTWLQEQSLSDQDFRQQTDLDKRRYSHEMDLQDVVGQQALAQIAARGGEERKSMTLQGEIDMQRDKLGFAHDRAMKILSGDIDREMMLLNADIDRERDEWYEASNIRAEDRRAVETFRTEERTSRRDMLNRITEIRTSDLPVEAQNELIQQEIWNHNVNVENGREYLTGTLGLDAPNVDMIDVDDYLVNEAYGPDPGGQDSPETEVLEDNNKGPAIEVDNNKGPSESEAPPAQVHTIPVPGLGQMTIDPRTGRVTPNFDAGSIASFFNPYI